MIDLRRTIALMGGLLAGLLLPPAIDGAVVGGTGVGLPVKEIRVEGRKHTREYIITRELATRVGESCTAETLQADVVRLLNLDIFGHVEVLADAEADSAVVTFSVVENFPILPSIALRITDENGISYGGGAKTPNLFGKDIYLSGRVLFGGEQNIELELENPWFAGNRLAYRVEYFHRNRENVIGDFYETADEVRLWLRVPLSTTTSLTPSYEFLSIQSDKDGVTLGEDNRDLSNRFGLAIGFDTRDAITDTRQGWNNEIKMSHDSDIFGSTTAFSQLDVDLRRYISLSEKRGQSLGLFALLSMRSSEVGEGIAPWQRFGIGGTNTVRGWEFAAKQGKNQLLTFVEYNWTLITPRLLKLPLNIKYRGGLQVSAFFDVGIGWDESQQFSTKEFIAGGGVGVRLLLPIISLARFDLGVGQPGVFMRIHIGSWEKAEMARKRVR